MDTATRPLHKYRHARVSLLHICSVSSKTGCMSLAFELRRAAKTQRMKHTSFDTVSCVVLDDEYSGVDVEFRFGIFTADAEPRRVVFFSVTVGGSWKRPGRNNVRRFTISLIRDLPLARWEQAARGVLAWAIDELAEWKDAPHQPVLQVKSTDRPGLSARSRLIDEMIRAIAPDLDGDQTPGGLRRLRSLRKSAAIALDYRNELMDGRSDPAMAIAENYGVSPSTARSWIHRARTAGFLAPAVGRTAGERLMSVFTGGNHNYASGSAAVEECGCLPGNHSQCYSKIEVDHYAAKYAAEAQAAIDKYAADGQAMVNRIAAQRDEAVAEARKLREQVEKLRQALDEAATNIAE